MSANRQPDISEVLEDEEPEGSEPSVLIRSETPFRTQELPHKAGATFTKPVTSTAAVRLLAADHHRARVNLFAIGGNMLLAFSNASSQDPSRMALIPANTSVVITAVTEVWVQAATGSITVSVLTELWATGEGVS